MHTRRATEQGRPARADAPLTSGRTGQAGGGQGGEPLGGTQNQGVTASTLPGDQSSPPHLPETEGRNE